MDLLPWKSSVILQNPEIRTADTHSSTARARYGLPTVRKKLYLMAILFEYYVILARLITVSYCICFPNYPIIDNLQHRMPVLQLAILVA